MVLGRMGRGEFIVFTLVERLTGSRIFLRADDKSVPHIMRLMEGLRQQYGENFRRVFRSITSDNGGAFDSLAFREA